VSSEGVLGKDEVPGRYARAPGARRGWSATDCGDETSPPLTAAGAAEMAEMLFDESPIDRERVKVY